MLSGKQKGRPHSTQPFFTVPLPWLLFLDYMSPTTEVELKHTTSHLGMGRSIGYKTRRVRQTSGRDDGLALLDSVSALFFQAKINKTTARRFNHHLRLEELKENGAQSRQRMNISAFYSSPYSSSWDTVDDDVVRLLCNGYSSDASNG